ncbi:Gfo/Idh/MocA family oxidoreductase [Planctomycetota bacterium]
MTRRDYLKASAALAGAFTLPQFAIGQSGASANSKINVALIGAGHIARTCFGECRKENVVAIAEVDDKTGAVGFETFPQAKRYKDFRKLLDAHDKELDLVIVSTPDHTHFVATYAAMEREIAVHTQKPLTHNIWQARTLQKAYRKFGVQTVMGNQGHNLEGMYKIREWIEAGLIGDIQEIHAWTNRTTNNIINAKNPLPAEPIPAHLDWDLWSGPNQVGVYNSKICPSGWRWWWQYGLGGLGDIGCHTLDIPKYALDLGYPSAVYMGNATNFQHLYSDKTRHPAGATYVYEFTLPERRTPLKVYWYEGGHLPKLPEGMVEKVGYKTIQSGGCLFMGSKNILYSPGMRPDSPRMIQNWSEVRRSLPEKTLPRAVGNPVKEIMAAVRGDIEKCGSNFDYAVPLTETVILGTIAIRSGKRVEYQPETMTFKDRSLNTYIREPVRSGWEYGEGLLG